MKYLFAFICIVSITQQTIPSGNESCTKIKQDPLLSIGIYENKRITLVQQQEKQRRLPNEKYPTKLIGKLVTIKNQGNPQNHPC